MLAKKRYTSGGANRSIGDPVLPKNQLIWEIAARGNSDPSLALLLVSDRLNSVQNGNWSSYRLAGKDC